MPMITLELMCNVLWKKLVVREQVGLVPPPPPSLCNWSGVCCTAARQNNELRMVAMPICLCHGGICELGIRCSWPLAMPPPPLGGNAHLT